MRFLLALIFIFLTTPFVASAHTGLEGPFVALSISLITIIPFLITASSLYLLRQKNYFLLLLVDIIFSGIYAGLLNFAFNRSSFTGDSLQWVIWEGYPVARGWGIIPIFVVLVVLFRLFAPIVFSKQFDRPNVNKIFLHLIITGFTTILFTFSFAYGSVRILYSSNCDKNLILNSYDRLARQSDCIRTTSLNRSDPEICNKYDSETSDNIARSVSYCKAQVNIKKVESGDLSGCDYLKSSEVDFFLLGGFDREEKIIIKCRVPDVAEIPEDISDPKLCEKVDTKGGYMRINEEGYPIGCLDHICEPDVAKSNCFAKFFNKAKNSQACEEVKGGVNRDNCFFVAASKLGNDQLCEKIEEEYWKKICPVLIPYSPYLINESQ